MTLRVYTNGQIQLDNHPISLFVTQGKHGTIVYTQADKLVPGGKRTEHPMPHKRYTLAYDTSDKPNVAGCLQFEADIRALLSRLESYDTIQTRGSMKTQHTPGPWYQGVGIQQYCVYDKKVWINSDGSRGGDTPNLVVVVSPADAIADARLIAAAPELLDACKAAFSGDKSYIEKCRAAIAKATRG